VAEEDAHERVARELSLTQSGREQLALYEHLIIQSLGGAPLEPRLRAIV
jgi:hypothetical protein